MKDKILMPRTLTFENGAKYALIGEYAQSSYETCYGCGGSGEDELLGMCDECGGDGRF